MTDNRSPFSGTADLKSPSHLDDQILAASRRLAPQPRKSLFPGWAPALATISLVAVAVVVVRPVFQSLEKEDAAMQATQELHGKASVDAGVVMEQEAKRESTSELVSDTPVSAELQSAAPAMQPAMEDTEEATAMKKQATVATPDEGSVSSESTRTAADLAAPSEALEQPTEWVGKASTSETQGGGAQALMEEDMVGESNPLDRYRKELASIVELVEAGKMEEANAQLAALRKQCPQCDLPDSPADIRLP